MYINRIYRPTWKSQAKIGQSNPAAMAAVMAAHAAALWTLFHIAPALPYDTPAAIMVSLLAAETKPMINTPPTRSKAVTPKAPSPAALAPQPIVAAASAATAPPAAAAPQAAIPAETPAPPQVVAVAAAVAPTATPVIPPHANADYLENPPPAYPPLSRRLGEQGKVMLRVLVNANGMADTVELKSSSGSSRLDEAALATVRRWRFVPARQGEQPVAAWTLIPITFSLKG